MRCDGADSSRASNWTMSKKDDAAAAAVLQYLVQQNRPYSAQDVFMNLHKEHSKAVVQKVIDQLVETQELREKVNGKQKCFVANQVKQFFFYSRYRNHKKDHYLHFFYWYISKENLV